MWIRTQYVYQLLSQHTSRTCRISLKLMLQKNRKSPKSSHKTVFRFIAMSIKLRHLHAWHRANPTHLSLIKLHFLLNSKSMQCIAKPTLPIQTMMESRSTRKPCWHITTQAVARCILPSVVSHRQAENSHHMLLTKEIFRDSKAMVDNWTR